jgi:multicomponent Na+:H+ antiporter subunit D
VLPFPVDYEPYSISHVLTQTELLFFSALAFCLLLLSGIYPAEQRAENLDTGWVYRTGWKKVYNILAGTFNPLNNGCEKMVRAVACASAFIFKDAPARIMLFVSVNIWLVFGIRGRYLKLRKSRLYNDAMEGTMPIGLGAATAVGFVILIYILT